MDYIAPPLTPAQIHFNTFITNALYFAIPNMKSLRSNNLKPILIERIDN